MILRTYTKNKLKTAVLSSIAVSFLLLPILDAGANDLTRIFAAASTTKPVTEIAAYLKREQGIDIVPVFAASGALARQIYQGAPADLFLSGNPTWMDWLQVRRRLTKGSRRNIVGNCLALSQPQGRTALPPLTRGFAEAFGGGRFVIGDPAYVPAGAYAVEALDKLGIWQSLESRAVRMPSVRHVLFLLERGEADAGIVYRSDALTSARVHIAELIDPSLHAPIVYPLALIERTEGSETRRSVYDFLVSKTAAQIFERHGFRSLAGSCSD